MHVLNSLTSKGGVGVIHRNKHSWIHKHERGLFEFLMSELWSEEYNQQRAMIRLEGILDIIQHKLGEHEP